MAALGAGAGAFQGDMEREAAAARRAQLGLQAQKMNQDAQQFYEKTKLDRERMASTEAENAAKRRDNADELALQQKNTDRQFALDEKQFQADRENDAYQRGINERQDDWREALNAQEIMEKQERIKTNRLQFEELDRAAKMEREKLSNRQRLAKTGLGALALSAFKNGGIASPAAIEVFNKQQEAAGTGIRVTSGVWTKEGFFFKREGPAVDQNGQPIQGKMVEYDEQMSPAIARAIFKDEFGEDLYAPIGGNSKAGAVELSKAGERLLNIRLGRIERERSDILKELAQDDAKVMLGDKEYKKLKDRLMQLDKDEDAAVYSAYGETTPAPSGNGAAQAAQSSVPPDVSAEQQKALKLAMQKPEKERRAYYDQHMKKFMSTRGNGGQAAQPEQTPQPAEQSQATQTGETGTQDQASASSFGPDRGDQAYWRDMPTGARRQDAQQAKPSAKEQRDAVNAQRKAILRRLEIAYRMEKGPEKTAAIAKIKAELDAFNEVNPL